MEEHIVDGIPVLVSEKERAPRTVRIKVRKGGRKRLRDTKLYKLDPQHKKALENYVAMGPDKKREAAVAAGFSRENAISTMDRLLVGRKEIVEKIEKECQEKCKKGTDDKIAEVLVEGLDATHPLSKEGKKDYKAIVKFAQEINKVTDKYPPKRIDIREQAVHIIFTKDDIAAAEAYKELSGEE